MIFKELSPQEISNREYYAYKQWVLTQDDSELKIFHAYEETGSYFYPFPEFEQTGSGGIYKRTVYNSIKHLYYYIDKRLDFTAANFYSQQASGSIYHNNFYAPDHNFGPNTFNIYKNLQDSAVVISISQAYIGDGIKPNSVHVEDVTQGYTLYDDGYGNLYDSTNSASFAANKASFTVGNVFYEHGNIVLTSLTSSYQTFGTSSNLVNIKYKSIQKIYEMETYCTVKEGEFNYTWNPSIRSGSSLNTPDLKGMVTSSEFCTYPTTIGLYNDENALVAIGKLAQPIRNDSDLVITFVVRLDW